MSLVLANRRAPFLAQRMGRQLAGLDREPRTPAGGKQPETECVAARLGALFAAAVALVRDLGALHADATHAPRIPVAGTATGGSSSWFDSAARSPYHDASFV